ncbi:MAG TPA: hypothetical protein VG410_06600 [Solirubrobacteraceae bacterium]|nr:hypothetical protein [Solirubrobacteraceae bacterium]
MQSTAQFQRDKAIARVGWTRRVVIAGAAALTATIAALVSAIAPGRTLGASRTLKTTVATAPVRSSTSTPRMPALASASQLGLVAGSAPGPDQQQQAPSQQAAPQPPPVQQAPAQPAPVQQPAPVVSGGS